ncbi:MAG TPA: hypothetical protein VF252_02815 [Gemmatimonadales bacterium]
MDRPRLAVFRALFLVDFRALFRADFRAVFRPPRLAAFLAPLRADFLAPLERLADLRELLFFALFLALFFRAGGRGRAAAGSLKSSKDEGLEVGAGAGVFSIGSGSIQPEPDQPISI